MFVKIKFVEHCAAYSDNIVQMRDSEKCVALTFTTIRRHLHGAAVHFSYLIKRKSDKAPIPAIAAVATPTNDGRGANKQPAYQPPNRGVLKANIVRKGPSVPLANGGHAPKKTEAEPTPLVDLREAATSPGVTTRPADYSSINRFHFDQMFKSPGKLKDFSTAFFFEF